ncbi:MAG: hypothetical protein ACI8RD_004017, partial [Bacillariaceae sp.]
TQCIGKLVHPLNHCDENIIVHISHHFCSQMELDTRKQGRFLLDI